MAEFGNPIEAPQSPSEHQGTLGQSRLSRFWFILGSIVCFFLVPMGLNWLFPIERHPRSIEIASLGGLAFLMAFWSIFLGWLLLLLGSRVPTIAVGVAGLMAVISLPIAVGDMTEFGTPMFWAWVVAYVILAVGGLRVSRGSVTH